MDPQSRAVIVSVAGGISALSLAYTAYRLLGCGGRRAGAWDPRELPASPEDVAVWLAGTRASPEVVRVFAHHQIGGDALLALSIPDLARMGIASKDRAAVMSALAALDGVRRAPTPTVPALALGRSPPAHRAHPSQAPPARAFLGDAEDLFADMVCPAAPADGAADPSLVAEEDQNQRLQMAARLYELLEGFQALSTVEQRDAMLPLARSLNTVLTRPTPRPTPRASVARQLSASREAPVAARAAPESAGLMEKLQPLHEMVDSFTKLLTAPDLDGIPLEELAPLADRIAAQLSRVAEVAGRLPPAQGRPLQVKCDAVAALLMQRVNATTTTTAPSAAAPAQQQREQVKEETATVAALIGRLRGVFQLTRDSNLMELEPAERLPAATRMVQEVESIRAVLRQMPSSEQVLTGMEVSDNVLSLLQQLQALSADEMRLQRTTEAAAQTDAAAREPDEGEAGGLADEFGAVTAAFLQRIVEVLESTPYRDSPPESRARILESLEARVDSLGDEALKLPRPQRGPAVAVIAQAKALLASAAADLQPGEEEEESGSDDGNGQAAKGEEGELDVAVTELENIFRLLSSDDFESAPADKKQLIAGKLLGRVRGLKASIAAALGGDGSANPVMSQLVLPLEELLEGMAGASSGPSEHLVQIADTLKEMDGVLSSTALRDAPRPRQQEIARSIVEHLQRITSTFDGLSPGECAVAEELIEPLNQKLVSFIRDDDATGAAARSVSATEDDLEEEEDEEPAHGDGDPRALIEALQEVMAVIQSPAFERATPTQRNGVIAECVETLRGLEARCRSLSPEPRAQLLPIAERLLSQMQFLQQAAATQGGPAKGPVAHPAEAHDEEREQRDTMFASIEDITGELQHGRSKGISLSSAETAPLWQLLEMVDSVGHLTPEETRLRDAFEAALKTSWDNAAEGSDAEQREEENSSSNSDDGEEDGDGDGLEPFLRVFASISSTLESKKFDSLAQLMPIMSIVESTLSAGEERSIPWQTDARAVAAVSEVLAGIRTAQDHLKKQGGAASPSVVALKDAAARIAAAPPRSRAELAPFLELLKKHMNAPTFSADEMAAMEALKDAIVAAGENIRSTDSEEVPTKETRISEAVMEMSDRLRDGDLTDEELDQYDDILSQLANAAHGNADITEAIAATRQQARLQRMLNGNDTAGTAAADAQSDDEESHNAFREDDGETSSVAMDSHNPTSVSDLHDATNGGRVVGGAENEATPLSGVE